MGLKEPDFKILKKIIAEHGDNYVRPYHELLAITNSLLTHPIYKRLFSIPKNGSYYIVGIKDEEKKYSRFGYTLSPFDYWFFLLKEKGIKINSVSDIEIMEVGLGKKEALRKSKEMNKVKHIYNRRVVIGEILNEV